MPRSGNTTARGYGWDYQQEKERWRPTVDAGRAQCHAHRCLMPTRYIPPGAPWDLGHTPDRTAITGPEHRRCNRSDGATRGNRRRGQHRAGRPNSINWL